MPLTGFFNSRWPFFDILSRLSEKILRASKVDWRDPPNHIKTGPQHYYQFYNILRRSLSLVDYIPDMVPSAMPFEDPALDPLAVNRLEIENNVGLTTDDWPRVEAYKVIKEAKVHHQDPFHVNFDEVMEMKKQGKSMQEINEDILQTGIMKAAALAVEAVSAKKDNTEDDYFYFGEVTNDIGDILAGLVSGHAEFENLRMAVDEEENAEALNEEQMQQRQVSLQRMANQNVFFNVMVSKWGLLKLLSLMDSSIKHRVEAIVVVGRLDRLELLQHYLDKNMRKNGGTLDRVNYVIYNAIQEEIDFTISKARSDPDSYLVTKGTGEGLGKIYSPAKDDYTIYVKIDDDIVFIGPKAIDNMVREKLKNECSFVSANVINHSILSAVHYEMGAIPDHYGPTIFDEETKEAWAPSIEKHAQSTCVWSLWQCAEWVHKAFFYQYYRRNLQAFHFNIYNFHIRGFGNFRTPGDPEIVPHTQSRWSINIGLSLIMT